LQPATTRRATGQTSRVPKVVTEGRCRRRRRTWRKHVGVSFPTNEDNPQIKLALAQYQRARMDFNDSDVKTPIDGLVTNTVLAPGQYASAGHTVATIVDTGAGWVVANLPEDTLGSIRIGDPVLITFNVSPGQIVQGRVASMASGVSQSVARGLAGPMTEAQSETRISVSAN